MKARPKALVLISLTAVAALVPLAGDPRTTAVTHTEWAHMLLRGLGMEEALRLTSTASQAFSLLSWKESLAFPADRFLHGQGVQVLEGGRVRATEPAAELAYGLSVLRLGDYRVRLRLQGRGGEPVVTELMPVNATQPAAVFTTVPPAAAGWIDAGEAHLDPGAYTASVRLAAGSVLERVEVAPPCLAPIEPPGGWRAQAVLDRDALALTTLQAVDGEFGLPPASAAIEVSASEFQVEPALLSASAPLEETPEGVLLRAGAQGQRALVFLRVPEDGLYTISVLGLRGHGQSWLLDACRKAVLCPDPATPARAEWQPILTGPLTAGRHFLALTLAPEAGVLRVRAERKRADAGSYVETLAQLGFDAGPAGPVDRSRAAAAMRFVAERRQRLRESLCGDVVLAPRRVDIALAQPAAITGAAVAPHPVGLPPLGLLPPPEPAPPPTIPPQVPVSPVLPEGGG